MAIKHDYTHCRVCGCELTNKEMNATGGICPACERNERDREKEKRRREGPADIED